MFKAYIKEVVYNLVKTHCSRDPFELAMALGITVKYADFGRLKGFYCNIANKRYIAINQNINEYESALICAHELGHDQLHRDMMRQMRFMKDETLFSACKVEYEANIFAANLLIPDDLISKYATSGYTISQIAACESLYPQLVKLKIDAG